MNEFEFQLTKAIGNSTIFQNLNCYTWYCFGYETAKDRGKKLTLIKFKKILTEFLRQQNEICDKKNKKVV